MPSNKAAWLTEAGKPLEVKSAPYTSPAANEIAIKNGAVAINPVDWFIQSQGVDPFPGMTIPFILGSDVAGEVVEVGSAVTRFKPSDRVLGFAMGGTHMKSTEGAFQDHTVLLEKMSSAIPPNLSYEDASVLPMGLSVSASGLYHKDFLALDYPSLTPTPNGKTLLVWGAATSMGSNAVQFAVASGYDVIATASAQNFFYVKSLGASQVFDYKSETVVEDLVQALKEKDVAGVFDSVGFNGAFEACGGVLQKTTGRKFVASCQYLPETIPEGIEAKFIWGSTLANNEVGDIIYGDFVPKALAAEKFIAAPEPKIAGRGLESIQAGIDLWRKGVSASKIVVSLQ